MMKNKILSTLCLIIGLSILVVSCKKTDIESPDTGNTEIVSQNDLNQYIKQQLNTKGRFEWNMANEPMIWSALEHGDHILSVGYRAKDFQQTEQQLHLIDIHSPEWVRSQKALMELIVRTEQELDPSITEEKIIPWGEEVLPVMDVVVKNRKTLDLLLSHELVRYAEPMSYEPFSEEASKQEQPSIDQAVLSSSGCGSNTAESGLILNTHYTNILPNSQQSWNYNVHGIPKAWSKSTGRGVKVFIIDTGCEFDQENLGTAFNQGSSTGRTVEKIVTLPRETFLGIPVGSAETPDDGCGHGTSMAGACAAPRGTDGNTCGIAYNCNLVTCRAAVDVYLDESREVKGAADAFTNAANRADVRIISMSMGKMTSSSQLTDAIRYAYGKQKLMFCAAGTSFSWTSGWYGVIFPAWLPEVSAVTGVMDNNFNTTCSNCHSGAETDFTVVMERASDNVKPLSLAMSGDLPSTVGGSSVSTASAAGIAALVWSRFPTLTRDQVLNKLITTSARYPTRSASLGWGNLNADAATN